MSMNLPYLWIVRQRFASEEENYFARWTTESFQQIDHQSHDKVNDTADELRLENSVRFVKEICSRVCSSTRFNIFHKIYSRYFERDRNAGKRKECWKNAFFLQERKRMHNLFASFILFVSLWYWSNPCLLLLQKLYVHFSKTTPFFNYSS